METELYQMGWNDTLGTILRATGCTVEEKDEYLLKLKDGTIGLPCTDPEYIRGVHESAQGLLDRQVMKFKGPQYVIDDMLSKTC